MSGRSGRRPLENHAKGGKVEGATRSSSIIGATANEGTKIYGSRKGEREMAIEMK
jgi:hypothetical protein